MTLHLDLRTPWRKSSFSGPDANCIEIAFGSWRKSTLSGPDSNCVELAHGTAVAAVRDSKNPGGPYLVLPPEGYHAFIRCSAHSSS